MAESINKSLPRTQDHLSLPRSSPGCTPPSSCPLAPGTWWWWEPRRYWRRRKGRPQSRPRKRWTSPCGCCGSDLGLPRSHRQNAARLCGQNEGVRMVNGNLGTCSDSRLHQEVSCLVYFPIWLLSFADSPLVLEVHRQVSEDPGTPDPIVLPAPIPSRILLLINRVTLFYILGCCIQCQETPGFPSGSLLPTRVCCHQKAVS